MTGFAAEFSCNTIEPAQNAKPPTRYINFMVYCACRIYYFAERQKFHAVFFAASFGGFQYPAFLHALREGIGASGLAAAFEERPGKLRRPAPGRVTDFLRQKSQSFANALFLSLHFLNTMLPYIHGFGDEGWDFVTISGKMMQRCCKSKGVMK